MKDKKNLFLVFLSIILMLVFSTGFLLFERKRQILSPSKTSTLNNIQNPTPTPCPSITLSDETQNNNNNQNSQNITSTPIQLRHCITPTIKTNITILPTATNAPIPSKITTIIPTNTPYIVLPEINIGNINKKQMIFTFDGGAGTQSMQKILDTLNKHNVKGTFFATGSWASQNQNYISIISSSGHEIFNHTYTHPYLTKTSDYQIITELNKTNDLILSLTGKTTKPYFRPPYGDRNSHVQDVAGSLGYRSVYWTVDALDWKESDGYTAEQVKQRIFANERNGSIVLMHIGDNITGQILDEVFTKIENDGYKIVSLTQGL